MNYEARFGGIGRLYGTRGLDILRNSRMAVVGIGAVSYTHLTLPTKA